MPFEPIARYDMLNHRRGVMVTPNDKRCPSDNTMKSSSGGALAAMVMAALVLFVLLPLVAHAAMNVPSGTWTSPSGISFSVDDFGNISNISANQHFTASCRNEGGVTSVGSSLDISFPLDNTSVLYPSNYADGGFTSFGTANFLQSAALGGSWHISMNYYILNAIPVTSYYITGYYIFDGSWFLPGYTKDKAILLSDCTGNANSGIFTATPVMPSPVGSLSVTSHSVVNNETIAVLALNATAYTGSSVTLMRFSNDKITWSAWETYVATKTWNAGVGTVSNTVYVQYQDSISRISRPYSATITEMGELDTSFNPPKGELTYGGSGLDMGSSIAVQPDGTIVMAGVYDPGTGVLSPMVLRT